MNGIGRRISGFVAALALVALASGCIKKENPWESDEGSVEAPPNSLFGDGAVIDDEAIAKMTWDEKLATARNYSARKEIDSAANVFTVCVKDAESFSNTDVRKVDIINELAYLYYFNGRLPEAEEMFHKLVAARKIFSGENDPSVAFDILKLANLKAFGNDFPASEVYFEQAMGAVLIEGAESDIKSNIMKDYILMLEKANWPEKIPLIQDRYNK